MANGKKGRLVVSNDGVDVSDINNMLAGIKSGTIELTGEWGPQDPTGHVGRPDQDGPRGDLYSGDISVLAKIFAQQVATSSFKTKVQEELAGRIVGIIWPIVMEADGTGLDICDEHIRQLFVAEKTGLIPVAIVRYKQWNADYYFVAAYELNNSCDLPYASRFLQAVGLKMRLARENEDADADAKREAVKTFLDSHKEEKANVFVPPPKSSGVNIDPIRAFQEAAMNGASIGSGYADPSVQ